LHAQLGWKNTVPVSLMMVTLLCTIVIPAVAAAGEVPFVIAQQQEEEASLGDKEEDPADDIVSDVLDGGMIKTKTKR
jgi:hypothetical protein